MLTGIHAYLMDRKGRAVIPPELRAGIGETCALVLLDSGLAAVMSEARYRALVQTDGEQRWGRWWLAGGWVLSVDATTGRILIPAAVRHELSLLPGAEVLWIGQGEWALVCGKSAWKRERDLLHSFLTEDRYRVWMRLLEVQDAVHGTQARP